MTNLKNAPLVYTIGVIKFPRIPNMERFTDGFHDKIRNEYPINDVFKVSVLNADFSSQGFQFAHSDSKVWQFTSVDLNWAFVLSDQTFCLHTVDYHDFLQFAERFLIGLNAIINISEIGMDWMTAVGIRYVNLIDIEAHKTVSEYIQSWVLPLEPSNEFLKTIEGAYVTRYKTDIGELRLQTLRNPQFTLPPELQSPLIIKNKWIKNRPKHEFVLIDIDHSITFDQPVKIEPQKVMKEFSILRETSKMVFESTGTKLAHKVWRGK